MKYVLGIILILAGCFVWAMMHFTSIGYQGWGIILAPVAILSGIVVLTDKS
jgi:hypothetical protein